MRRLAAFPLLMLALAACGQRSVALVNPQETPTASSSALPEGSPSAGPSPSQPPKGHPPTPKPTASPGPSGTLRFDQRMKEGGPLYTEGSQAYARLTQGERLIFDEHIEGRTCSPTQWCVQFQRSLAPGAYELTSYQRPCNANCDHLDEPTDVCSTPITIRDGGVTTVEVEVTPGAGCTMRVS